MFKKIMTRIVGSEYTGKWLLESLCKAVKVLHQTPWVPERILKNVFCHRRFSDTLLITFDESSPSSFWSSASVVTLKPFQTK